MVVEAVVIAVVAEVRYNMLRESLHSSVTISHYPLIHYLPWVKHLHRLLVPPRTPQYFNDRDDLRAIV